MFQAQDQKAGSASRQTTWILAGYASAGIAASRPIKWYFGR